MDFIPGIKIRTIHAGTQLACGEYIRAGRQQVCRPVLPLVAIVERFDVIAIEIDTERLEPAFLRQYHPSSVRWVLIQRFLDAKGLDYERILIADARETFFQTDPFDIIGEPGDY